MFLHLFQYLLFKQTTLRIAFVFLPIYFLLIFFTNQKMIIYFITISIFIIILPFIKISISPFKNNSHHPYHRLISNFHLNSTNSNSLTITLRCPNLLGCTSLKFIYFLIFIIINIFWYWNIILLYCISINIFLYLLFIFF